MNTFMVIGWGGQCRVVLWVLAVCKEEAKEFASNRYVENYRVLVEEVVQVDQTRSFCTSLAIDLDRGLHVVQPPLRGEGGVDESDALFMVHSTVDECEVIDDLCIFVRCQDSNDAERCIENCYLNGEVAVGRTTITKLAKHTSGCCERVCACIAFDASGPKAIQPHTQRVQEARETSPEPRPPPTYGIMSLYLSGALEG